MTISCRDCDSIPKVANAGAIVSEGGNSVQIMHNGVRVIAGGYYGDWMAEIIQRLQGHHEPQEELVFNEILKHVPRRATMLELGGFWSYYSLWFLNDAPDFRRAIVIEPDPDNLSVGQTNAKINGRKIEFIQASVGEISSEPRAFQAESAGMIAVPQVSVPDLFSARDIGYLDILHCDTQGAETAIIRSCETLMRERRIRFVVVSTHAHQISGDPLTHQRCLSMLKEFGGRILAEHDVHESFSGDGLIAAYFGAEPIDWPQLDIGYNRYSTSLFPNPLYELDEALTKFSTLELRSQQQEQQILAVLSDRDERIKSLEGENKSLRLLLDAAAENLRSAQEDAESAKWENDKLRASNASILSSTSWRVTAPMRTFARIFKRQRPG